MKNLMYRIFLILIIVFTILLLFSIFNPSKKPSSSTYEVINQDNTSEIKDGDLLKQTFISEKDYYAVGLPIATYNKVLENGTIKIIIYDQKLKKTTFKIKASSIVDNQVYYIKYNFKKDNTYKIEITTSNLSSPITFSTTRKKIENAKLIKNNIQREDNIILSFLYKKDNYLNAWYYLFGISIILFLMIMMESGKNEK